MSVYLNGRGRLVVDVAYEYPDGSVTRVRKVSPVQTRRGAEQYERELRQALAQGDRRRDGKEAETLASFADDFLKTYAEANNKPSEVYQKRLILKNHLTPFFGAKRLDQITTRDVEAFKARQRKKYSAKTVNNELAVLSTLLETAIDWGKIETAPRIKLLKTGVQTFRWLTEDELARLTVGAGPAWRLPVLFTARTGLRLGELRALRWVDLDLARERLFVRQAAWRQTVGTPKGGREREVPLTSEIVGALREHPRRLGSEYVFPDVDGGLLSHDVCRVAMAQATKTAGVKCGWHALRHTFASHLVQRGVPLYEVKELLGHVDIKTTLRYAHLAPDSGRRAVAVLEVVRG